MVLRDRLLWAGVILLGAISFGIVALTRGEPVNAAWLVVAAVCIYFIAYRFYALFIADKVFGVDAKRATPAYRHNDGLDYVPTNRYVLFGHHFAAIAGAGPLVGPVLAAQMGYLPGTLWILAGVVFAGAVQDMTVLFLSTRRDGRSLGDMIRSELGPIPGAIAGIGILMICIIVLAVLALVVVMALKGSPWGTFAVFCTIPIALIMGVYSRFIRPGRIGEMSALGVILLLAALVFGKTVSESPELAPWFTFSGSTLALIVIAYGFCASVLPVWLLLAPRDYLSTFLKIGTILLLAIGIMIVRPDLQMSAVTKFVDGSGPVWAGSLFPFLFITIACGAVSGWHALISSGTTPKMIENERQIPLIGYGAMLMESLVAIMAMIAATVIHPGVYFAMNSSAALIGADPGHAAQVITSWGFTVTPDMLTQVAKDVGETTIMSRTGGAPTLAVGMASILSGFLGGKLMAGIWYHFAILFEALFILTTVDAGTRVCRFMIQDLVGNVVPAFKATEFVGQQPDRFGTGLSAVGLFPVSGRDRSVGRHLDAMAAVRHRQPDAGGDRADLVHRGAVQDEAPALRVGDDRAGDLAGALHGDGRHGEGVQRQSGGRFPQPRAALQRRAGGRQSAGAGEESAGNGAGRVQRLCRRDTCRRVRGTRGGDGRVRCDPLPPRHGQPKEHHQ